MISTRMIVSLNPKIKELPKLAELTDRDMKKITTEVDKVFRRQQKNIFSTEGASSVGRWAALSPDYRDYKKKKRPGRKIMVFDGKVRKGFSNKGGEHVATYTRLPTAKIKVGARGDAARVASYHVGDPATHNPNLPVRDVITRSTGQQKELTEKVDVHLAGKLKRILKVLLAGELQMQRLRETRLRRHRAEARTSKVRRR